MQYEELVLIEAVWLFYDSNSTKFINFLNPGVTL